MHSQRPISVTKGAIKGLGLRIVKAGRKPQLVRTLELSMSLGGGEERLSDAASSLLIAYVQLGKLRVWNAVANRRHNLNADESDHFLSVFGEKGDLNASAGGHSLGEIDSVCSRAIEGLQEGRYLRRIGRRGRANGE